VASDEWLVASGEELGEETFCTLYSALCTLHSALCTLHSALCTLRGVVFLVEMGYKEGFGGHDVTALPLRTLHFLW
ncbi:MAG: hypothetical protein FWH27_18535, partial [Planctomycetaceae bacterium]|nr:hypothetical protein [Planctomycetaceae bacterium]